MSDEARAQRPHQHELALSVGVGALIRGLGAALKISANFQLPKNRKIFTAYKIIKIWWIRIWDYTDTDQTRIMKSYLQTSVTRALVYVSVPLLLSEDLVKTTLFPISVVH